jgi:hypothetical protein
LPNTANCSASPRATASADALGTAVVEPGVATVGGPLGAPVVDVAAVLVPGPPGPVDAVEPPGIELGDEPEALDVSLLPEVAAAPPEGDDAPGTDVDSPPCADVPTEVAAPSDESSSDETMATIVTAAMITAPTVRANHNRDRGGVAPGGSAAGRVSMIRRQAPTA